MAHESVRLTAVIAEDDRLHSKIIKDFCNRSGVRVLASVSSGTRLIEACLSLRPDLVLLDISLEKLDGISAYRCILKAGNQPQVVLVTGSLDPCHILTAMNEMHAVAYLTKPIGYDLFDKAVRRAAEIIRMNRLASRVGRSSHQSRIELTVGNRKMSVPENAIAYIEVAGKQCLRVVFASGEAMEASGTLRDVKTQADTLFSPNRSYLVHPGHILAVLPDPLISGNHIILMRNSDITIPLTRRNFKDFQKMMELSRSKHASIGSRPQDRMQVSDYVPVLP